MVVSDEEDLDEDENMEAFKNLFDKRVFRVYITRNHFKKIFKQFIYYHFDRGFRFDHL